MNAVHLASVARAAVVLLPALLLALHHIDSSDVWFHLATGRLVLEGGGLPASDPFAAYPAETRWLVHDWLGSVALYALYALGRAPALVIGCAVASVAALGIALAGRMTASQRRAREWAVLVATFLCYERFFVRPEVVSLLFAAVFTRVAAREGPLRHRTIVALVAAQILWANTHAGFILGPVIFWLVPLGHGLDRFLAPEKARPPIRRAWWLALALTTACFVTPYGWETWRHALRAVQAASGDAVRFGIAEWQPTFAGAWYEDPALLLFAASLGWVALGIWRGRRHLDGFQLALVLVMSVLACAARRHVPFFAVTVLPLAADAWARGPSFARAPRAGRIAALAAPAVALLLAADIARGGFYARFGPPRELGFGVSHSDHCIGAGEFVAQHDLDGPLFNNVAAGSYLVWRLRGEPRAFVDGRLLDAEHFAAYRRLLADPIAFDGRDFRLAVLALQPHPPLQLLRHLARSSSWRLGFMDGEGAVFVHVETLRERPDVTPWNLETALPAIEAAGNACDRGGMRARGNLLAQIGCATAAAADLERVLASCPERWDVGLELATALNAAGRSAEARPLVERALQQAPHSSTAWVEWGWLLGAAGDVAGARAAWERALDLHPVDPRAARLLAAAPR